MKGTPATAARPAASVALFAALLLAATACSSSPSGPTSAQAEKQLQKDFATAIKFYDGEHNSEPPFQVTADGTKDVTCGKGKARRTYSMQRQLSGKGVTDAFFVNTRVGDIVDFLGAGDVYMPDSDKHENDAPVTITQKVTSTKHHTQAVITGKVVSGDFVLTLDGTTDCLRAS